MSTTQRRRTTPAHAIQVLSLTLLLTAFPPCFSRVLESHKGRRREPAANNTSADFAPVRNSLECVKRAVETIPSQQFDCVKPVCGPLQTTLSLPPFQDRLSLECQWTMLKSHMVALPRIDRSELPPHLQGTANERCLQNWESRTPTNPVVVHNDVSNPFVMCTVPKAGCSLLRSLLVVLTRHPEPVSWVGERANVHTVQYPSLHHYTQSTFGDLPANFPSFVVARSPYLRVLSGFLDKMTLDRETGHDWKTMASVNRGLKRPEDALYEPNKEGFAEFVKDLMVAFRNGTTVNEHFMPAVSVCDMANVQYHYRLRLEDMEEWYPCWVEGLDLHNMTQTRWDHSKGKTKDWYADDNTECWWTPQGMTCTEYGERTRNEWGYARPGGPGLGRAEEAHAEPKGDAAGHDIHATASADKVADYFTQESADVVYELYEMDFKAFGYQRWVLDA